MPKRTSEDTIVPSEFYLTRYPKHHEPFGTEAEHVEETYLLSEDLRELDKVRRRLMPREGSSASRMKRPLDVALFFWLGFRKL
ncbi:hypothetical protein C2S52_017186 [Perilla frutescens var. hirtella]|nr:hypothetical protein C2S52_017186 [Perilla frutescens var. hirtella]